MNIAIIGAGGPVLIDVAQGDDVLLGHVTQVARALAASADDGDVQAIVGGLLPADALGSS